MSRLQTYWCARFFRKEIPVAKKKKGGIILVGGGDGSMSKAIDTAESLFHKMNTVSVGAAYSHNTENISPIADEIVIKNMKIILEQFNCKSSIHGI